MNSLYSWVSTLLGVPVTGSNSTIVQIAGVALVMTYVICLDLLFNGIFRLFRRK